ncbi:helix-turn-helix domain-containing protein [Thermodesulfobacteriota bacterium]
MKYHIKITKRTNQALKTKMEESCMTVGNLSYKVGVDKAIISKILHRKLSPSKIMMMKIANIFECDSRVIFPDGYGKDHEVLEEREKLFNETEIKLNNEKDNPKTPVRHYEYVEKIVGRANKDAGRIYFPKSEIGKVKKIIIED